jgi:hypothetical protein
MSAISRIRPDWALPLLPLEFFRHYWQYVALPVPELVEVAQKADISAPAVLLDLAATPGVEIRFKRPGVPLMRLKSYQIDAPADERASSKSGFRRVIFCVASIRLLRACWANFAGSCSLSTARSGGPRSIPKLKTITGRIWTYARDDRPFATVVRTTFDDNDLSTVKSRLLSSRSPRVPPACQRL